MAMGTETATAEAEINKCRLILTEPPQSMNMHRAAALFYGAAAHFFIKQLFALPRWLRTPVPRTPSYASSLRMCHFELCKIEVFAISPRMMCFFIGDEAAPSSSLHKQSNR